MAKMRYLIHKPIPYALLSLTDFLLKCVVPKSKLSSQQPKRLLLCNGAHLGDVILTTALLEPLAHAFPDLKIGMLVGSWARQVIEGHPLISWIHTVDHWKLNRNQVPKIRKIRQYQHTFRQAFREIQAVGYDTAVDCPFHFPNAAPLLFRAQIPVRIGFASAGFGPLFTKAYTLQNPLSAAHAFYSLLHTWIPNEPTCLKPSLARQKFSKKSYVVLHLGAGDFHKEWPLKNWKELAFRLAKAGQELYFTGQGLQEYYAIEDVRSHINCGINLCSQLPWPEFVRCISQARLVIGVDSCAGHLAAAVDTPAVLFYQAQATLWRPLSDKIQILIPNHNEPVSVSCAYQAIQKYLCSNCESLQGSIAH